MTMPYVRIWLHLIWSTKNREPILAKDLRPIVFKHISENAKRKGIFLVEINGFIEHVHTLLSLGSDQAIAKVSQLLKGESSYWINKNSLTRTKFEWQDEYFAISVCESMVDNVREYIRGQEEHHKKKSFGEEYQELLRGNGFTPDGLKSE
jgi:REP element-mobilizing transposase RayT